MVVAISYAGLMGFYRTLYGGLKDFIGGLISLIPLIFVGENRSKIV